MLSYEDLRNATAGDERDALWRSLEQDVAEIRRGGRGMIQAERPADLARALGRDRRAQDPRRARSAS
ncbi:hypothetical protein ASF60_18030 [Methylobacterium sp. Leaf113]|uniref:hypothetical protein n=1 Tax=Methylobacterium sp. Leaf113 TaxID=1736259 RepID=UPI0006FA214B|nr:hypothetical protein [Methylobacterium sp. Leaf113]KQP91343.1 hypothetical protein ASF60_18030 [Methylobacterium sp. Leaf113]